MGLVQFYCTEWYRKLKKGGGDVHPTRGKVGGGDRGVQGHRGGDRPRPRRRRGVGRRELCERQGGGGPRRVGGRREGRRGSRRPGRRVEGRRREAAVRRGGPGVRPAAARADYPGLTAIDRATSKRLGKNVWRVTDESLAGMPSRAFRRVTLSLHPPTI